MIFYKQNKWEWHTKFVWLPVRLESENDHKHKYAYMQKVEQRISRAGVWEYRLLPGEARDITIHRS